MQIVWERKWLNKLVSNTNIRSYPKHFNHGQHPHNLAGTDQQRPQHRAGQECFEKEILVCNYDWGEFLLQFIDSPKQTPIKTNQITIIIRIAISIIIIYSEIICGKFHFPEILEQFVEISICIQLAIINICNILWFRWRNTQIAYVYRVIPSRICIEGICLRKKI